MLRQTKFEYLVNFISNILYNKYGIFHTFNSWFSSDCLRRVSLVLRIAYCIIYGCWGDGVEGDFTAQWRVFPDHCEVLLVRGRRAPKGGLLRCSSIHLNLKKKNQISSRHDLIKLFTIQPK